MNRIELVSITALLLAYNTQLAEAVICQPVVGAIPTPPSTPTPTPPTPTTTAASPDGTIIMPGGAAFSDGTNTFQITAAGVVNENNKAIPGGSGTAKGEWWDNQSYFQDGGTGAWYTWSGSTFVSAAAPGTLTPPTPPSTPPTPPTAATGNFTIVNGQIIDPNGKVWHGAGVDVHSSNLAQAVSGPNAVTTKFPGIGIVRVTTGDYESLQPPATYAASVKTLTDLGIVVQFSDYGNNGQGGSGGSQGTIYTGSALATENNWFAAMAAYYKGNPYVWLGTQNEPTQCYPDSGGNAGSCTGGSIYSSGPKTLSAWQASNYNAVRGAGNNNLFFLEPSGTAPTSGNPRPNNAGTPLQSNMDTSYYANMTGVVWDPHIYPYMTNSSDDPTVNANLVTAVINSVQKIKSKDGIVPVVVGEYGPLDGGFHVAMYNAVHNNGVPTSAWVWDNQAVVGGPSNDNPNNSDGLLIGGNITNPYGIAVQAHIKAVASASPPTPVTPPPPPSPPSPPSPNNTVVMAGSSAAITDSAGHTWTISSGNAILQDGSPAAYTANVAEMAYIDNVIWQENTSSQWYSWNSNTNAWVSGTNPMPATPPTPPVTPPTPPVTPPTPPVTPPTPPTPPTTTESPNNTVVMAGSTTAITDEDGDAWTISAAGEVLKNGQAPVFSSNVAEIAYVSGTMFQENVSGQWYSWNNHTNTWVGGPNPFATLECTTLNPVMGQFTCTYKTP